MVNAPSSLRITYLLCYTSFMCTKGHNTAFDSWVGRETIDKDMLLLPKPIHSTNTLFVMRRVPICIHQDHSICAGDVDTYPTRLNKHTFKRMRWLENTSTTPFSYLGWQEHDFKCVVVIESIDDGLSILYTNIIRSGTDFSKQHDQLTGCGVAPSIRDTLKSLNSNIVCR